MVPEPGCAVRTLKSLKNHIFKKPSLGNLKIKPKHHLETSFLTQVVSLTGIEISTVDLKDFIKESIVFPVKKFKVQ